MWKFTCIFFMWTMFSIKIYIYLTIQYFLDTPKSIYICSYIIKSFCEYILIYSYVYVFMPISIYFLYVLLSHFIHITATCFLEISA